MSFTKKSFAMGVFFFLLTGTAFAQGGATGAISGTVQDKSGGVITGAKVEVDSDATREKMRELITNSSGQFIATLLPAGIYTIQVSAPGFALTKFPGIEVRITETTTMTAVLSVTATKTEVTVSAEIATIDTSSPTTGEVIDNTTITTLPLATRNFQTLLTLSAGASSDLNNASQLGRGQVFIHVNGGREDNNNYLIDGITAADYAFGELTYTPLPNPDAIEEFKVSTSLYDATQGRNGGGNINAILKGGTSSYHFDGWEYFRNTVLDANDWFINEADKPRPVIKQNIFGADGGGQVDPNDKKWGFFYVNYQGTRQRSGDSPGTFINSSIPILPPGPNGRSDASLESAFSFAGNAQCPAEPVTAIDPVASKLLNAKSNQFGGDANGFLIPSLPGTPGVTVTFNPMTNSCATSVNSAQLLLTQVGKYSDDQFTGNWDKEFRGGRDRLSERFFWSDSSTFEPFGADSFPIQTGGVPTPNNLNFPLTIPLHSRFGSITETHLFTPNLVNEFRFGINIISDKLLNHAVVTAADLGINRPTTEPDIYRFQFGSYAIGSYPTSTQTALGDSFVFSNTVSWTHGPHTLRFGGEADRTTLRRNLPVANNGLIFFAGPQAPTDFQGFLQGSPFFGEAGGGLGNHDYRIPAFALFAQDDYRFSKTLTLNLGFRTEFLGAPYDDLCHIGNTNPELASTTGQPFIYPGCVNRFDLAGFQGSEKKCALNNCYASVWEPRVGIAYDLFGRHTTSIRAGYGIYSVREDLGAVDNLSFTPPVFPIAVNFLPGPGSLTNLFEPNLPAFPGIPANGMLDPAFVPAAAKFTGIAPCSTLAFGAVTATALDQCSPGYTGNVNSLVALQVPLHWVAATTQQWNLTVQHEFGHDWFGEAGYVGTKGTRLRATYDPDQATLATPANPFTINGTNCDGTTGAGAKCVIINSTAENASARAPFPGIAPANFESFAPISDSHYEALQLTAAHRFAKGLYFQSAYTYSKSIDDVSTASVAFDTRINDQLNPRDSRGLSDFDRRHRFVTSFVYQLPFFAHATGLTGAALGGWETSGVLTLQSGLPLTPIDSAGGSAYAFSSPNLATPTFAGSHSCANSNSPGGTEARIANWLNPAAFQPDAIVPLVPAPPPPSPIGDATVLGDVPRNCFIGPPQKNMDFTIGKTFHITERQSLRFRTDFFNLTNHPSFANPSALDIESPSSFTSITSVVGTPRLIQFSLKYSY
ncbi:MAG: carboxypeptidase regulatory-like domain-containing protein [Candidatus Acidiferrales bacterium]